MDGWMAGQLGSWAAGRLTDGRMDGFPDGGLQARFGRDEGVHVYTCMRSRVWLMGRIDDRD